MIAAGVLVVIVLSAVGLSNSGGSSSSQAPQSATPTAPATTPLADTSTCSEWQNASGSDNQTYADLQGESIGGTDVSSYLTSTCSSFLNNTSNDPQIGDIVIYLHHHGDTGTHPCDEYSDSTLPSCY